MPTRLQEQTAVRVRLDGREGQKAGNAIVYLGWDYFRCGTEDSALYTRGWVLQERILAPRVLHCTRSGAFWECSEAELCSAYPQGPPEGYSRQTMFASTSLKRSLTPPKASVVVGKGARSNAQRFGRSRSLQDRWQELVEAFSKCRLTVPSDKLPAVAGIASRFAALEVDDRYCAGLWLNTICQDLLWCSHARESSRAANCRAPSWSWACIDGPIDFRYGTDEEESIKIGRRFLISVKSVATIAAYPAHDPDHLGEINDAQLTLSGRLIPAQWSGGTEAGDSLYYRGLSFNVLLESPDGRWSHGASIDVDDGADSRSSDLFFLPVRDYAKLNTLVPNKSDRVPSLRWFDQRIFGLGLVSTGERSGQRAWKLVGLISASVSEIGFDFTKGEEQDILIA